jgi:predicted DNA-binding protein YlxM (UPF0122 family)
LNKKIDISKEELKRPYYKDYLSLNKIAKKFDVSIWKISSLFKKYNLKLRKKNYSIKLDKKILINMYKKRKLTTVEIAKNLGCSIGTINLRLRNYGIKIISHPQYKHIPKHVLESLYVNKKLSTIKVAKKLNCSKSTINEKLSRYGIKIRNHVGAGKLRTDFKEKYKIPIKMLKELYYNKKLSMQQIADKYGVYISLISHRFKKHKLKSRTVEEGIALAIPRRSINVGKAVIKYPKKPFSNNLLEKAYLFGFAAGDLYVNKKKYGSTVRVETSTTKEVQVELVKDLFEKYTHLGISKNKDGQYQISCNLHDSFDFLLAYNKDKIPTWILKNDNIFLSFLGGYIDAEGHFGAPCNIGNFILGSYDKGILFETSNRLRRFGIIVEGPKLTVEKGHVDKRGVKWNGDMWGIRIRRMRELYKFISLIKPYIKHKKRYNDMINVKNNLLSRTRRINLNEEFLHSYGN